MAVWWLGWLDISIITIVSEWTQMIFACGLPPSFPGRSITIFGLFASILFLAVVVTLVVSAAVLFLLAIAFVVVVVIAVPLLFDGAFTFVFVVLLVLVRVLVVLFAITEKIVCIRRI